MGCPEGNVLIQLESGEIAAVDNFTYLGSNITNDSEVAKEVRARMGKAARALDTCDPPSLIAGHSVCKLKEVCIKLW